MNDRDLAKKLIDPLEHFIRYEFEEKFVDPVTHEVEFTKEEVVNQAYEIANKSVKDGVVEKGDLVTLKKLIKQYSESGEKYEPQSVEIAKVEQALKQSGNVSKEKIKETVANLNRLKETNIVTTRDSIQRQLERTLAAYQIENISGSLPAVPFIFTDEANLSVINASTIGGSKHGEKPGVVGSAGKIAAQQATGIAAKRAGTALAARFSALGGPAAAVVGTVVAKYGPEIVSWGKRNAKYVLAGVVGVVGYIVGGPIWGVIGAASGWIIAGGLLGAGIAAAATGAITAGFGAIGTLFAASIQAVLVPTLITLISLPIIIVLIIFIINSGALVVPLGPNISPGAIVSPYIEVTKTAVPNCINRPGCPDFGTVIYEVSISPKKGTLTNIKIQNQYLVTGKDMQAPSPTIEALSDIPETISPGSSFTFSYPVEIGEEYNDSIISDTVSVSADAPEQDGALASASATIIVGDPPIDCPIPGGTILWGSYSGSSGHGSPAYWQGTGISPYSYSIPQTSSCRQPNDCAYYGYAMDVFPRGTTEVIAPTINRESLGWEFNGVIFANGGGANGYTFGYTDTTGRYSMLLTHIKNNPITNRVINSGEKIVDLFPQGGNTHLHMEFQANGVYQKPEIFFCQ